jgi:lysophospholipase L1-like esterase
MKLLTLGIAVLIVLVGAETFALGTMSTKNSQASPIRVACVGDSITAGTDYSVDLWLLLGPNYVLGNFGDSGATVSLNSDNPYRNTSAFQAAEQFKPDIVIIMLGTNDAHTDLEEAKATFVNDYVKLITDFQGLASKPKLWIVKPPPIFNNTANLNAEYLTKNVNPGIDEVAHKTGVPVIDVCTPLTDHPDCFPDGIHPDDNGSKTIAKSIYNALISPENK